jgi:ABC-type multidrug transport system ATPase subunit
MGPSVMGSLRDFIQKLQDSEIKIKNERDLIPEHIETVEGVEGQFKVVEMEKVVDDVKIPFNLLAPINMPITNKQLKELYKDQFIIASCYKMLKFGVTGDKESEDFLRQTLRIDQNESDLRRTNCEFKKHHIKHTVRVPNVKFETYLTKEEDINKRMLDVEYGLLSKVDLFHINKSPEPTDGFMIFDKADANSIKGTLSSNNIQFFAYHHSNFMNEAHTAEDLTVYMNTETHFTILDILSNSLLMNGPNKNTEAKERSKQKLASFFQTLFNEMSQEDFYEYIKKENTESEDSKEYKNENKSWFDAAADRLRQILSFTMTFPDRDFNKVILTNMFQLLNVIFYPFAIGLGLPIILNSLAMEKEEKIHDLLKINGMSMFKYYLANILFWFVFFSIITAIFFVGGYFMLDDGLFRLNSPFDIIVFCVGWNLVQIVFAFFLLTMINSAGSGSAVGYIFTSIGNLWAINIVTFIYPFPAHVPIGFNLIPQMNFCRIIYFFLVKGSGQVKDNEKKEFNTLIFFLYLNILIYGLLTYIISRKKMWKRLFSKFKKKPVEEEKEEKKSLSDSQSKSQMEEILKSYTKVDSDDTDDEEKHKGRLDIFEEWSTFNPEILKTMHYSALREKRQIFELINSLENNPEKTKELESYAVMVKSLVKKYENGKMALNDLNLRIQKGEVYGLLGPNGAGKTTLISIITSFLGKTSGNVFVNGKDMDNHQTPNTLALCPQFNIQWPDLTVAEHLWIFGMLREIPCNRLGREVDKIIEQVDLVEKKDSAASTLSGGMRRRLSIAIALMGNTEIIFLDEPTTGLDPKRRRELWDIIKKLKENKTFIISTHLMEEAEFLCDKIGVINRGNLRATGSANFLKNELVDYYQAELTVKEGLGGWTSERKEKVEMELKGKIIYQFQNLAKIKIKKQKIKNYLDLFDAIEKCGEFVKSWSLKSGSLEDAFAVIEQKYVD